MSFNQMETMRLVEKHVIRHGSREWKEIDNLAFKSKRHTLVVAASNVDCTSQKSALNLAPT